jgi:hypothetical protein
MDLKTHWETVYSTKTPQEVSWTQETPSTSLRLITEMNLSKNISIIDIGGGDSKLVDFLLEEGYTDLTVLDISENAISRAKSRLGDKSNQVTWIIADINNFTPQKKYGIWHDRAVFHFITDNSEIQRYVDLVSNYTSELFIVGTFSKDGPLKCSGLAIKQYNEKELSQKFGGSFQLISSLNEDHKTPFNTLQNFTFASFKKIILT